MIDIDDLPEEIREKVFITEDNLLFLPEGELAAQDVYKKWLENRGKQIDICSVKEQMIQQSKELLAIWLINNPLVSSVHGGVEATYTVTEEKQSLLTQNLLIAQLKQSSTTTWNCQGGVCEEWTVQELSQLALEIESYVKPRIKKQQTYEVQINLCTTIEEVEAVEIEYETIS